MSVCRHIGSVSPETKNERSTSVPGGLEDCRAIEATPQRHANRVTIVAKNWLLARDIVGAT